MIVKAITNTHCALIQQICYDQWHLQKCYGRLRALEVISHPPDPDVFQKFVSDLVCLFFALYFLCIDALLLRDTFIR